MDSLDGAGVASPCVGVCKLDAETGFCTGCLRTLPEIGAWSRASDPEKRAVLTLIEERRAQGHRVVEPKAEPQA